MALQQPQHNLHAPDELLFTPRAAELRETSPQTHIEIEEGIHLVLNNGDRLEQLLRIHGPHHAVHSAWTHGESEQERAARRDGRWRDTDERAKQKTVNDLDKPSIINRTERLHRAAFEKVYLTFHTQPHFFKN